MQTLTFERSIDQLEESLISLAQRRNVLEYEFLKDVREFEIRQGWRLYLFNDCAEWLNMKCGIVRATAREKARVAMALFDLPQCAAAFEEGLLSYSNARSLTRIADRNNEGELLGYALQATASQVQEHCKQIRNANRQVSTQDANRVHRNRWLSCHHDGDGMTRLSVELPQEAGELVMKAIEIAGASLTEDYGDAADKDGFFARQADALVEVVKGFLAGGSGKTGSTADHYQVLVHVDESALKDEGGKSDFPVETMRRITCDASVVEVTQDAERNPLDLGRKKRVVSPQLKRALLSRDKHCSYPGCAHDKWLDAHHVTHWADGGETSLDNCILICSHHHRLLHEGGYTIEKNYKGERYFKNTYGKVLAANNFYQSGNPYQSGKATASRDARASHVAEFPRVYAVEYPRVLPAGEFRPITVNAEHWHQQDVGNMSHALR